MPNSPSPWTSSAITADTTTLPQQRMSDTQNSTTTTQASAAANSSSSLSTESVTGIVFGICATVASFVTIWQAHRAWKNRHKQLPTNPKTTNHNAFDLSEGSTFATRRSSSFAATAGVSPSSFVTVPEACITRTANKAVLLPSAAPPIADQQLLLTPIAAQSPSARNQVSPALATTGSSSSSSSSTPSTTRLPALQAALHRLGLSANHEAWDRPDEAPRLFFSSQQSSKSTATTTASTARESAVRAAIDGLMSSSFDESDADPSELVGDSQLPPPSERPTTPGTERRESSSRVR